MSRLLMYTDVHCSRTSSILPPYSNEGSIYTTRLQMIIDSFKWMYETADRYQIDTIINLGDLFDKNHLKCDELTAVSDCYKLSHGIPEIHIVGNHELLDEDKNFYATSILKNYSFIKIYDHPDVINDEISVLPYMNYKNISYDLLDSIDNKILLSHIDIKGSSVRSGYDLTCGVDPEFLLMNFDKVFNGHIHKRSIVKEGSDSDKYIMNIGSMSSISFADSNTYIPGITVFDTKTNDVQFIENPYTILFRKFTANSVSELDKIFSNLDKKFRYVLCVTCPYEKRSDIDDYINSRCENNEILIVAYKICTTINSHMLTPDNDIVRQFNLSTDIKSDFISFIKSDEGSKQIKYPIDKVIDVLGEV